MFTQRSTAVEAIERLNRGESPSVFQNADNGSPELLETILRDEEEHADWLESQLGLIRQLGEVQYLSQQIHD